MLTECINTLYEHTLVCPFKAMYHGFFNVLFSIYHYSCINTRSSSLYQIRHPALLLAFDVQEDKIVPSDQTKRSSVLSSLPNLTI